MRPILTRRRFRVSWPPWVVLRGAPGRALPLRRPRPDVAGAAVEYSVARRADLAGIARVFEQSFRDSIEHLFGRPPAPRVHRDLFLLCYRAERRGLHVARVDGRVVGYAFSPARMSALYRRAMLRGHLWRWARRWLRGEYRFGMHPVRALMLDKFAFVRSSLQGGPRRFPEARILSIAVDPAARGRGIAGALLRQALAYLRESGAPVVRLEVRPENRPAVRLYERHAFRRVGTMADSRGPWLVMERRIDLD